LVNGVLQANLVTWSWNGGVASAAIALNKREGREKLSRHDHFGTLTTADKDLEEKPLRDWPNPVLALDMGFIPVRR